MVWYNLKLKVKEKDFECKYTTLSIPQKEYPYCDSNGNILKRVSGKMEKGYYINEAGERFDGVALRLIKGKPKMALSGKIKQAETTIVEKGESEDLLTEKEFLIENDGLYNELVKDNIEVKFDGWFGNGYKAYRVYVIPSQLYKGFCIMKAGRGQKSDIIKGLVQERNDIEDMKAKLDSISLAENKITKTEVEDLF